MFKFEEGKMYTMPVVFGPCVTPRQKPGGGRWVYDDPTKITMYKVVCEVSADRLNEILPEKYELLSPHVVISFCAQRELAWLAGGSYDIVHVEIPVHFKGTKDDVYAMFEPVLWEDLTEAILTGREQLGYSKIFGNIQTMEEKDGKAYGSISNNGFCFLEMKIDLDEKPEDEEALKAVLLDQRLNGKVHFKYMPRTGAPFTTPSECCTVHGPAKGWEPDDFKPMERSKFDPIYCKGELIWHRPNWEDMPAQAHIIQFLSDMGFKRYLGAVKTIAYSHNDIYAQHVIE